MDPAESHLAMECGPPRPSGGNEQGDETCGWSVICRDLAQSLPRKSLKRDALCLTLCLCELARVWCGASGFKSHFYSPTTGLIINFRAAFEFRAPFVQYGHSHNSRLL